MIGKDLFLGYFPEGFEDGTLCAGDNGRLGDMALQTYLEIEDRLVFLKVISQLMNDDPGSTEIERLRRFVSDAATMLEQFQEETRSENMRAPRPPEPDDQELANVTRIK